MISELEVFFRLSTAAILSSAIGFEREHVSWFAGLRTHMLVCVGATLVMIVSQYGFEEVLRADLVRLDPSRVAAQVISGIGFLGAGTILFWKNMIRGLTTAASLWAVAAIGLAVGAGLYLAAIIATALILFILAGIKPFEKYFLKKQRIGGTIKFIFNTGSFAINSFENLFLQENLSLKTARLKIEIQGEKEIFNLVFTELFPQASLLKIIDKTRNLPGFISIELLDETNNT